MSSVEETPDDVYAKYDQLYRVSSNTGQSLGSGTNSEDGSPSVVHVSDECRYIEMSKGGPTDVSHRTARQRELQICNVCGDGNQQEKFYEPYGECPYCGEEIAQLPDHLRHSDCP